MSLSDLNTRLGVSHREILPPQITLNLTPNVTYMLLHCNIYVTLVMGSTLA